MAFKLRDYQQKSVDIAIQWVKRSTEPALLELATGAGKSLIVAEIARQTHELSGKRILCIAPSAELTQQNYEKFIATGNPASIYSASITKNLRHDVIYATPGTFINAPEIIKKQFSTVIIDEAHGITATIQSIIDELRGYNKLLRVIGMSATPYRLGEGYIYKLDDNGKSENPEGYFTKLLYRVTAAYLIEQGYLTPPTIGAIEAGGYDVSSLAENPNRKYTDKQLAEVFVGKGRKTAQIIADIVNQSRTRKGVMIFAATIQHAQEIMESLPPEAARMITGNTKITSKAERKKIINDFKAMRFKYIVNVAVLTTGFDAPHVDVVAILRKTESASLYQQIIGRGMRLYDGKEDFLLLDYAENIETLFKDHDVLTVKIENKSSKESAPKDFNCPVCNTINSFSLRENDGGFDISKDGYFLDLDGNTINCEFGPIPAHYGRRCGGINERNGERCGHYWTAKDCPECGEKNDISARYCTTCRAEIINPNDKLTIEFKARRRDLRLPHTEELKTCHIVRRVSQAGNDMYAASFVTCERSFTAYFIIDSNNLVVRRNTAMFEETINNKPSEEWPKTITYRKRGEFFEVIGFNNITDKEKLNNEIEENNARGGLLGFQRSMS